MNKLLKYKKILVVIFSALIVSYFGTSVFRLTEKPESMIEKYVYALSEQNYNKTYDFFDIKKTDLTAKKRFVEKMEYWDRNSDSDKSSYLSKIKGKINKVTVKEIINPDFTIGNDKKIEYYSLSDIGDIYRRDKEENSEFNTESWKFYSVHIFVSKADGNNIDVSTSMAVRKNKGLFGGYNIIDPCLLRDVDIEVPKDAEVLLDGIKLTKFKATNRDTDYYTLNCVFPGEYKVVLNHPDAVKPYNGRFILSANPRNGSSYELIKKLQFKIKPNAFKKRMGYVVCKDVTMYERPKAVFEQTIDMFSEKITTVMVLDKQEGTDSNRAVVNVPILPLTVDGKTYQLRQGHPVQIEKESGGFSQCNIVINYELKSVVIANDKLKKDSNAIWYKVETPNGSIGWVYGNFVKLRWE